MGRAPRKIGDAIGELRRELAPRTPLAAAQAAWAGAVGPEFAERCRVVGLRDGVVSVECESAVWAQELDLNQREIVARLRAVEGVGEVRSLRPQTGFRRSGEN